MDLHLGADAAAVFYKVTKIYQRGWRRPPLVALDQLSLTVPWGQVFGLIGPNRAGKTTLVKILLSICHPSAGRVMRLGAPDSDRATLGQVGYVHENPAFPRYLTARQLLKGYGRLSGVASNRVSSRADELLELVGLADRPDETIAAFSKGMLQRLALAQSLVNEPRLLVLDEPSEGMDAQARQLLHRVIAQRRDLGYTVILISHSLADVERLCDRVAVLQDGRLAFVGRPDELTSRCVDTAPICLESAVLPLYEGASV